MTRFGSRTRAFAQVLACAVLVLASVPSIAAAAASQPTLNVQAVRTTERDSARTVQVPVTLSRASRRVVRVGWRVVPGTATVRDVRSARGVLTIRPGVRRASIVVTVVGDDAVEATESVRVVLSSPVGAKLGRASAVVTILDDDVAAPVEPDPAPYVPPTVSIAGATQAEGNGGTSDLAYAVTLSAPSVRTITVGAGVASTGTATAGTDFSATQATITFAPGQTAATYAVQVSGDLSHELAQTVDVALSAPVNASLAAGASTATGTIANDDAVPAISVADVSQDEGTTTGTSTLQFTLTQSVASELSASVHVATVDGTALAGEDYIAVDQDVAFAPGQAQAVVDVTIYHEPTYEADETFGLQLTTPADATISTPAATATIRNDDSPPPLAPGGVTAVPASTTSVQLNWSAAATATLYSVFRGTSAGGPYTRFTTTATSYLDSGRTANTTYYYVVRASNPGGVSPATAEVAATTDKSCITGDGDAGQVAIPVGSLTNGAITTRSSVLCRGAERWYQVIASDTPNANGYVSLRVALTPGANAPSGTSPNLDLCVQVGSLGTTETCSTLLGTNVDVITLGKATTAGNDSFTVYVRVVGASPVAATDFTVSFAAGHDCGPTPASCTIVVP